MITDINPTVDAGGTRLTFVASQDQHVGHIDARQGCHRCQHHHRLRLYRGASVISESWLVAGRDHAAGDRVRFWMDPHVDIVAGETYSIEIADQDGTPIPWRGEE